MVERSSRKERGGKQLEKKGAPTEKIISSIAEECYLKGKREITICGRLLE